MQWTGHSRKLEKFKWDVALGRDQWIYVAIWSSEVNDILFSMTSSTYTHAEARCYISLRKISSNLQSLVWCQGTAMRCDWCQKPGYYFCSSSCQTSVSCELGSSHPSETASIVAMREVGISVTIPSKPNLTHNKTSAFALIVPVCSIVPGTFAYENSHSSLAWNRSASHLGWMRKEQGLLPRYFLFRLMTCEYKCVRCAMKMDKEGDSKLYKCGTADVTSCLRWDATEEEIKLFWELICKIGGSSTGDV